MKIIFRMVFRCLTSIDWPLMLILLLLAAVGMVVMHSAVGSTDARFADQARNFYVALFAMWVVAVTPPSVILKLAVPFYVLGILLLVAVMFVGETSKGATRWLNLGITRIQPSEMMKIAVPLMLAWYFHKREGPMKFLDLCAASLLLLVPFLLIVKQPDLGTAILVFGAGFFVIYFAGISFKFLIPVLLIGVIGIGTIYTNQETLCDDDFDWVVLHD